MKKTLSNSEWLENIRCFLLDMDGTFYLENELLPGANEFIKYCNSNKIKYLFITNNSSKNASDYIIKLHNLGILIDTNQIITSGEATCWYINRHYPGKKVFLAGTQALVDEFKAHQIHLVEEKPELIVLGFDTTITYNKFWKLCDYVRTGLPYIATHHDINCPIQGGYKPDIGAFISFIEASTGRKPDVIIGKPFQPMLSIIQERVGLPNNEICMVGDRLYTDIAMNRTGIHTILVLTGETNLKQARQSKFQADLIVNGLGDILKLLIQ